MSSSPAESRSHYWDWMFTGESPNHKYLIPGVLKALAAIPGGGRILDVGCGNGAVTARLAKAGYDVTGLDFTSSGLTRAREAYPNLEFIEHDITEPLPLELQGSFDIVLSAEVIEHLFLPRSVMTRAREALGGQGTVIVTTPYHGYWKNLSLALTNHFDDHWASLSDYGHIKFFSVKTLGELARGCGFEPTQWDRCGRIPPFAATMIMTAVARPLVPSS